MSRPADVGVILKQVGASLTALGDLLCAEPDAERPEDVLTLAEAAKIARTSSRALLALIAAGTLPATRPKGVRGYRVRRKDVASLFEPQLTKPEPKAAPPPAPRARVLSPDDEAAALLERNGFRLRRPA